MASLAFEPGPAGRDLSHIEAGADLARLFNGLRDAPRDRFAIGHDSIDLAIWRRIDRKLRAMRIAGRRSLRVVDAGCGEGVWLLRTVRRARTLGFTAIEGRGIDTAPLMNAHARAAAFRDPTVGLAFDRGDLVSGLAAEADEPADIVLSLDGALNDIPAAGRGAAARALCAAGELLFVKARSEDSVPDLPAGCSAWRDAARDRLEIDLRDGTHISIPSHPFSAGELEALFAPHGQVVMRAETSRLCAGAGCVAVEVQVEHLQ